MSSFWSTFQGNLREACRRSVWLTLTLGVLLLMVVAMTAMQAALAGIGWVLSLNSLEIRHVLSGQWEGIAYASVAFRLIQAANQILVWLVPAWLMHRLIYPGAPWLGVRVQNKRLLALAPVTALACLPLASALELTAQDFSFPDALQGLEAWIKSMEATGVRTLRMVLTEPDMLWANLLVFALVPAVCEEAFFRGFVQKHLQRVLPLHAAVWLSAAIFSFIHLQFLGFFSRMAVGAMLGYLFAYSRNLKAPMAAHFFFNGISVVAVSLGAPIDTSPEWWQGPLKWSVALFSVAVAYFLWRAFKHFSHE